MRQVEKVLTGQPWGNEQKGYSKVVWFQISSNTIYVNAPVDEKEFTSSYWHHVGLVLQQAAGLEDGYHGRLNVKPHRNVSVFGLYLISTSGDMEGKQVRFQYFRH